MLDTSDNIFLPGILDMESLVTIMNRIKENVSLLLMTLNQVFDSIMMTMELREKYRAYDNS